MEGEGGARRARVFLRLSAEKTKRSRSFGPHLILSTAWTTRFRRTGLSLGKELRLGRSMFGLVGVPRIFSELGAAFSVKIGF